MRSRVRWLLVSLGAAACGDPVVGPGYWGTPSFAVRGSVVEVDGRVETPEDENLRLSLFWIGFDSRMRQRPNIEQRAEVDSGLATFEMAVFGEPPEEALAFSDLATGGTARLGVALIVLYADNNSNGELNSYAPREEGPDTVLGASDSHLIVFNTEPPHVSSEAAHLFGALAPGYHLFGVTSRSACRFVVAESCTGEGMLLQADPAEEGVVLSLYADEATVRVPSPALPGGSGTGEAGNLYRGR